jgi:hypothetical protein
VELSRTEIAAESRELWPFCWRGALWPALLMLAGVLLCAVDVENVRPLAFAALAAGVGAELGVLARPRVGADALIMVSALSGAMGLAVSLALA